ncbi:tRNA pseudouridine(38-40) synthase TruA [Salegentibacter chungangensis]|uniref:tRNA pseudouridine synthase A n=1 Tax=Salegentibacter chungangensis TaxID=1335724 RepID=A0ABW3NQS8_9FLAO
MRYFIELAYFGKAFHGWQIQPNAPSVQEAVEKALSTVLQKEIEIVGAGRTDAGVHAKQLYAHFDLEQEFDEEHLVFRCNSLLSRDIALKRIFKVKPDAHARFDATSRSYEYHIHHLKDPFQYEYSYYLKREPDLKKMNKAAGFLKNYTNFKCFSKSKTDVMTYNCKIEEAVWKKENGKLVFYITADRFLRNMVRAIVGTLLEIGLGKIEVEEMHEVIKSQDRGKAGTSVPAHGLYLTKIEYPNIEVN